MKDLLDSLHTKHFVNPPATAAQIETFEKLAGWNLDPDLREFYLCTNGAMLFRKFDSPFRILPLDEIIRTRIAVYGSDDPQYGPDAWWAIVFVQDGNYLAIDLERRTNNRFAIRDIFHETASNPEYCSVICFSFGEFLANALVSEGDHFWL